ncbi:MAG: sugar phosphate isomerase/epimerase family protein [Phycisphaerae bacterium]|nr:sugar phosphate isomerase/epimerase family protein [Phycisphaerae bacterium]
MHSELSPTAPLACLGTVAPIGFDDFASPEWLGAYRDLGCTRVQAYRAQNKEVSVSQMRDYLAAGQMPCDSLHGIYGEQYDPSAPDEEARKFAVDALRREGELALQLGGDLVVVHCSTIRRDGVSPAERAMRMKQLSMSMQELGTFGQQMGVRYAFENMPDYHACGSDVVKLVQLLDDTAAANTGLCLDTGHANMTGDAVEAVNQVGNQMIYVHLCDNSGVEDEHEMPGKGTLDLHNLALGFHLSGYAGTIMLEVFYSLPRLQAMIDEGLGQVLGEFIRTVRQGDS